MFIRSGPSRVALTLALPAQALLIALFLRQWIESTYEPLFLAASATIAWLCGARYGFIASLLSALVLDLFFLPPVNNLKVFDAATQVRLFLFLSTNAIVVTLIHYLRSLRDDLAECERKSRSLAELIPFGGWTADSRGNMISLSESFLKTFNTDMDRCRGLGWTMLLEEVDRPQILADWRACMKSGYFWDYEYRLRTASGRQHIVLSRGIPFQGRDNVRTWIGIHLDITQRERDAEHRIEQARDLARFNAELDQLAYVSAHDLQEPLRMIASYLQLLSRRYKGKLDSEADTFIEYAVEGAERLKSLLQDLLELQQVGKGDRRRTFLPLSDAFNKACLDLSGAIQQRSAEITCLELPTIQGEERDFVHLFRHLLDNAIKYSREGIPPRIHVSAKRKSETTDVWQIQVQDNGLGIASEFTGKIFDVFQRLHPRQEYPGTGIGLAICKKIVEVYGGEISVESTPGQGSTFCFTVHAIHEPAT